MNNFGEFVFKLKSYLAPTVKAFLLALFNGNKAELQVWLDRMRSQSPGYNNVDDLRYLLKVLYISWPTTWAAFFPTQKHIDTWIRQASQLLLSEAHISTTLTWADAEEQYRGLVKFLQTLAQFPDQYRIDTQPVVKQVEQWWHSLPKVGKMVASTGVVITPVELPSVQSRGPQQHSVLFAGVNTSLKPDDIELVTGIQPESVESCEQGLVVKLKSLEDRDKMLALSGQIILRQGRVTISTWNAATTTRRHVFTIVCPGATVTDAKTLTEIILNVQLVTEPVVSNGVIEFEVTPESAAQLKTIPSCLYKGAPRKVEEKITEAAEEVPVAILYGIPEGFDEPKIVSSLNLICGVDLTGKIKFVEEHQLVIVYQLEHSIDWMGLPLMLRGKKITVAPFSPFIVKLSNIPIDLYSEDKLTAKLYEDVPAALILGVYLDSKVQVAFVHLRAAEAKAVLVKKQSIDIGINLESKSAYVELRVINLPPSTRISDIVRPLGRLISARIGTVRIDEDTHTAYVPVPSNVVQRALDIQNFVVNNQQVQIIAEVESSSNATITFKTPAMLRYLRRFALNELETIKKSYNVGVEGLEDESGMHVRLVPATHTEVNQVHKAKEHLKVFLDGLTESKIQLSYPARYQVLFDRLIALVNVPCATIVKEKLASSSNIKVYIAGTKSLVEDLSQVVKNFKVSIIEETISLNGNQREYIERDYDKITAPYVNAPVDVELLQNTVRISGIGPVTNDVIALVRETLNERFYKVVMKEKPVVTPARLQHLLSCEQDTIRQFVKAKRLLEVKYYINPVVNSITLSGPKTQVELLQDELKSLLDSLHAIQFSYAPNIQEADVLRIESELNAFCVLNNLSLSHPLPSSKTVAMICGKDKELMDQLWDLVEKDFGPKVLIRHSSPATPAHKSSTSSVVPSTSYVANPKLSGSAKISLQSSITSTPTVKATTIVVGYHSPPSLRKSAEKRPIPVVNELHLAAISDRSPVLDNTAHCYHHHCPRCKGFHSVEVRFTCPTCSKLKMSAAITPQPDMTWGKLLVQKQLLCQFGELQSYLSVRDLAEMNEKQGKYNELMNIFPGLKKSWPTHEEFKKIYKTALKEQHSQYTIEFYCSNCPSDPVSRFNPQDVPLATIVQTLHTLLINFEIRRDPMPRTQPNLPDINQYLKMKELEIKGTQSLLQGSGITDMTHTVLSERLKEPKFNEFVATELDSKYLPHSFATPEQLLKFREFGRVLAYTMIYRSSARFVAALPLWKYLTNRPIGPLDLYFMFPTLFDNLLRILPVQNSSKYELAKAIAKWKLFDTVEAGLKEIAAGLFEVVPAAIIERLTPQELEEKVNGPFRLEVDEWRKQLQLEGVKQSVLDKFWTYFNSQPQSVRQKILYCMSGQLRLIPEQKYVIESKAELSDPLFVPKQRKLTLPMYDSQPGEFERSTAEITQFVTTL